MTDGERYLELCLRLRRHDPELVDAYFGPADLEQRIQEEPLAEPARLVEDAHRLAEGADSDYLRAQARGLEVVARKLGGEAIPYADEVERCYGIRPRRVPEDEFEDAHRTLDELLPAGGTLAERSLRWREAASVPADKVFRVTSELNARLRERTREVVGLPEGEDTELELVSGEHWSAYNYYLGGLRSRVAINTDIPVLATSVAHLVAHELYPGHHTERAWKEQLLFRGEGRLEESVVMYGTPESVISEGIAELALELVVEEPDQLTAEVLGAEGIDYDAELGGRIREARHVLDRVPTNAAILLHEDGVSPEEAKAYIQRWWLAPEDRAEKMLAFVTDPIGAAYIGTYTEGYDLCRGWVDGRPDRFKRLLTEQFTPADLAA